MKALGIALGIILICSIIQPEVFAHRHGCHSKHSCESDSNTYICGDKGDCTLCKDNQYCKAGIPINPNSKRKSSPQYLEEIPKQCKIINNMPDNSCTPGAINPEVIQENLKSTVCMSGYSKQIRPSTSYTNPLKIKLMRSYGINGNPSDYELDHLIPLSIGGAPKDPKNLWPQKWNGEKGAKAKDVIERQAHRDLCKGKLTLQQAQSIFISGWMTN